MLKKSQKNKTAQLHSIETNMENSVLQTAPAIPLQPLLLRTCREVSIDTFIQCACNNVYSGLVKQGHPTLDEILSAWNEVLFEYATLIKSENSDVVFEMRKQISLLQYHVFYTENAVIILRYRYDTDVANELRGLGYDVLEDFEHEDYQKKLDFVLSLYKSKIFELDMLHEEYEKVTNISGGKQLNEEDFESNVAWLGRFQNYHIDTFTTSIYKFAIVFNNYLADYKARLKVNS